MARRRLTKNERDLLDAIAERIAAYPPSEIRPEGVKEAARLAAAALHCKDSLDDIVGPTCSTSAIATWWDVSRQAIHKAIGQSRIVAVQDAKRTWHFPTWQLREDRNPVAGIAETLALLEQLPQSAQAAWYTHPSNYLDGLTPAQWLIEKRDLDLARKAARKYATSYMRSQRNKGI